MRFLRRVIILLLILVPSVLAVSADTLGKLEWESYLLKKEVERQYRNISVVRQNLNRVQAGIDRINERWVIDKFEVTGYTLAEGNGDGVTSLGRVPIAGRTVAVDPKVIKYDSVIITQGRILRAEDTGGDIKGNRLDIYFGEGYESWKKAIKYGRRVETVIILRNME